MKTFALASFILPARAFMGPGLGFQGRSSTLATPLHYCADRNPDEYDSSFEDMRREFTSPSEPSAEKVKQVVDRTFRFFQDLSRDASSSKTEQLRNEELLGKLQTWIDRTIEFSDALSRNYPEPEKRMEVASPTSDYDGAAAVPTGAYAPEIAFESRTTDDAFEVQLDVPGVELSDLDIRLDETLKIVTVLGQRGGRSFSRGVALDSEADIQQLSATLKNGVLTLRAPKVKPPTKNLKRIPVIVADA